MSVLLKMRSRMHRRCEFWQALDYPFHGDEWDASSAKAGNPGGALYHVTPLHNPRCGIQRSTKVYIAFRNYIERVEVLYTFTEYPRRFYYICRRCINRQGLHNLYILPTKFVLTLQRGIYLHHYLVYWRYGSRSFELFRYLLITHIEVSVSVVDYWSLTGCTPDLDRIVPDTSLPV